MVLDKKVLRYNTVSQMRPQEPFLIIPFRNVVILKHTTQKTMSSKKIQLGGHTTLPG